MPSVIDQVVVIGGGACGMTAALTLARSGVKVTVLEREPRPGGLCGTEEHKGFRFDLGGHRFLTRSPALKSLVHDLLGEDLLERTRWRVVLYRNQRYRYPIELDDVVRKFPLQEAISAVGSYLSNQAIGRVAGAADVSFEDW